MAVVESDIYRPATVASALERGQDAAVMAVVADPLKASTVVRDMVFTLASAMRAAGLKRSLDITGTAPMPATPFGAVTQFFIRAADHQAAFEILRASNLDYALAACPYIKNGEHTGKYRTVAGPFPGGHNTISPQNVADCFVTELGAGRHHRQAVGVWYSRSSAAKQPLDLVAGRRLRGLAFKCVRRGPVRHRPKMEASRNWDGFGRAQNVRAGLEAQQGWGGNGQLRPHGTHTGRREQGNTDQGQHGNCAGERRPGVDPSQLAADLARRPEFFQGAAHGLGLAQAGGAQVQHPLGDVSAQLLQGVSPGATGQAAGGPPQVALQGVHVFPPSACSRAAKVRNCSRLSPSTRRPLSVSR